ncbi:HAD family hydrolase [Rivibacter subsaxonicus]|uniref:Putative hydrolase of the HAD superfamily n=1 Tax=Rivibacter subsaxonicus TaxID=457575 RepID=A0A4Q7W019_9BURK|nr:HAD-IA family hydrolase [Rivibacter subsaxonicus]RZU02534.1 putative hydrolase of the HAD superfamily [Rivibacter subsaxonicus]
MNLHAVHASPIAAITLDLDDTLWPIWPTIARAERQLHDWLAANAPATAGLGAVALRRWRERAAAEHPQWAHDLTRLRLEAIRGALGEAGEDPALAEPAFEVFFAARQQVDCYADVAPALERIARRWPILALTNGNADLARIGLAQWFSAGQLGAREFGVGKPDPRFFAAACARLGLPAQAVLHVGDDARLDVAGACAAGLRTAWIRRPGLAAAAEHADPPQADWQGADLIALADWLGA